MPSPAITTPGPPVTGALLHSVPATAAAAAPSTITDGHRKQYGKPANYRDDRLTDRCVAVLGATTIVCTANRLTADNAPQLLLLLLFFLFNVEGVCIALRTISKLRSVTCHTGSQ